MSFRLIDSEQEPQIPSGQISEQQNEEETKSPLQKSIQGAKELFDIESGLPHQAASTGASIASMALGFPGDILQLVNGLAGGASSLITGKPGKKYEETFLGRNIQTSQQVEDDIHKLLPYTKPRNDYEKTTNNIISNATSLLIPGAQAKVGKFLSTSPVTRAFFKSIGSELIGEGVKDLTADERKGELAKGGALFTMSLLDRQGIGRYVGQLYNRAENALGLARDPSVNATRLVNNLQSTKNRLSTGTLAASESAVVQDIERALSHVQNGQIPVENLWGISRSLNERRQEAMRAAPSGADRVRARRFYDSVIHDVNIELKSYGEINPEFGVPFQQAQEGFGTLARSNAITNWVKNNIKDNPVTTGLLHLFGGGLGAGLVKAGVSTTGVGAPYAAYQTAKLLYRVMRSPTLRKYYFESLKGASRENAQLFNRSVNKLDKVLEKENENKFKYKLVD